MMDYCDNQIDLHGLIPIAGASLGLAVVPYIRRAFNSAFTDKSHSTSETSVSEAYGPVKVKFSPLAAKRKYDHMKKLLGKTRKQHKMELKALRAKCKALVAHAIYTATEPELVEMIPEDIIVEEIIYGNGSFAMDTSVFVRAEGDVAAAAEVAAEFAAPDTPDVSLDIAAEYAAPDMPDAALEVVAEYAAPDIPDEPLEVAAKYAPADKPDIWAYTIEVQTDIAQTKTCEVQTDVDEIKIELEKCKTIVEAEINLRKECMQDLVKSKEDLSQMQKLNDKIKKELREKESKVHELNKTMTDIREEYKFDAGAAEYEYELLKKINIKLNFDIGVMRKELRKKELKIVDLNNDIAVMGYDHGKTEEKYKLQFKTFVYELAKKQNINKKLKADVAAYYKELEDKEYFVIDLNHRYEELYEETKKQYELELKKVNLRNDTLKEDITYSKKELKKKESIIIELKKRVSLNEAANENTREEYELKLKDSRKECELKLQDSRKEYEVKVRQAHAKLQELEFQLKKEMRLRRKSSRKVRFSDQVKVREIEIKLADDNPMAMGDMTDAKHKSTAGNSSGRYNEYCELIHEVDDGLIASAGNAPQSNADFRTSSQLHETATDVEATVPSFVNAVGSLRPQPVSQ